MEMILVDVIDIYTSLENLGVEIWIDGGWGVDALLGEQTRPHKDLDIAIQQRDVPILRQFLQARQYRDIKLKKARAGILCWVMKTVGKSMFTPSCLMIREMDCTARPKRRDVPRCFINRNWQDTKPNREMYFARMSGQVSFRLSTEGKGLSRRICFVQEVWD
jgi:hypothetical protein